MSMECFGRASLGTVMNTDARLRALLANPAGIVASEILVSDVLGWRAGLSLTVGKGRDPGVAIHSSTTNPLTATALIYALGAGITAGAGTRLVLQLLLDVGWF